MLADPLLNADLPHDRRYATPHDSRQSQGLLNAGRTSFREKISIFQLAADPP
jgi:hypothetical protein